MNRLSNGKVGLLLTASVSNPGSDLYRCHCLARVHFARARVGAAWPRCMQRRGVDLTWRSPLPLGVPLHPSAPPASSSPEGPEEDREQPRHAPFLRDAPVSKSSRRRRGALLPSVPPPHPQSCLSRSVLPRFAFPDEFSL